MRFIWARKVLAGAAVVVGLLFVLVLILAWPSFRTYPTIYGVTFSVAHARGLGLEWKETYGAILDDLGVRHLRLSAYWDEIMPEPNTYDFTDLDWQMNEAGRRGADVVLGVGRKLPRWPECHVPTWARGLSEEDQQQAVLAMLKTVVSRYREHEALLMWQLENEPLLSFGHCPPEDRDFLRAEESVVRSLDATHLILVTDSGELNSWLAIAQFGDMVGTTMYRTVFSGRTQRLFHYDYIFPAWMYRLKSRYVKLLTGKEVLVSELQGEPWGAVPFPEMTQEERRASFSPERFAQLRHFVERSQLSPVYWWGVEYWYWEKREHGEAAYWDYAREVFKERDGFAEGQSTGYD